MRASADGWPWSLTPIRDLYDLVEIPHGWRGAIADHDLIQAVFDSGRIAAPALNERIEALSLSASAAFVVWKAGPAIVVLTPEALLTRDRREVLLELDLTIRCPQPESGMPLPNVFMSSDTIARTVNSAAHRAAQEEVEQREADELSGDRGFCEAVARHVRSRIAPVLTAHGCELVSLERAEARLVIGIKTLTVGSQWQVLDGDTRWSVRLNKIETRRHGFLWTEESPVAMSLEAAGAGERSVQTVRFGEPSRLALGSRVFQYHVLSGDASRVEVRVEERISSFRGALP